MVRYLRWRIGALLFASTAINYVDRQALNVLAPSLKAEYGWTNRDFALIVIAFRSSYAVVQLLGESGKRLESPDGQLRGGRQ